MWKRLGEPLIRSSVSGKLYDCAPMSVVFVTSMLSGFAPDAKTVTVTFATSMPTYSKVSPEKLGAPPALLNA